MEKKILIPTKLQTVAKTTLEKHGYLVIQDGETPLATLCERHPDTEGMIVRSEKITAAIMDQLPKLRAVVRAGSGFDTIDVKYARSKKIDVMNTPGANSNAVAEQTIGLMLSVARHFVPADQSTRSGLWEKDKFWGSELAGKTLGIVGLGAIGQLLCKRLQGFDMTILGYDPFISADRAADLGVSLVSLQDLFSKSNFVSLHVPVTDETRGMVNTSLLSLLPEGAVIVNCARHEILNEEDFRKIKPLKKLKLCNDVYPADKAGPKTIADIADVLLPHLGASTLESNSNAARMAADILVDLWEKGITRFVVNAAVPAELDEKYQELLHIMTRLARAWLGGNTLRQIEVSFYGKLEPFFQWMISPIVSALDPTFDISSNHQEALNYLKAKGIEFQVRTPDNAKKYGESITLDLFCGFTHLERVSLRGTLTEGAIMISRVADFDKLYFDPQGDNLFFTYEDRPAVLGKITSILGQAGINIHDIRAPHNKNKDRSLSVIKVDKAVDKAVVDRISTEIKAENGFYVKL
jgi:D-3-phosphoglycerate dehydrogenase